MRLLPFALLLVPSIALGDADAISRKLDQYESEARTLATNLPPPNQLSAAQGERKLVDAQVAFSLGDYDNAALALFDLAGKQQGSDREAAQYYLAESLFQKGDRGAARGYFAELVKSSGVQSKYYQPSLQRLVEIAIAEKDVAGGEEAIRQLDGISAGLKQPSVPYVRGKFAFATGKYDDALAYFNEVPKGSDYELQSLYYTGTTAVAKKDLAKATDVFNDLINRKPRNAVDRRVIELGQLALGRIYYEREQPGKSIDSYLLVDRHSDLFPDALYEVAWVYVKSKQYDKALRALELLEKSEPNTTKTPTVRILEGNLRIRKAQMLRQAQILGTINPHESSDPATEYDKAAKLFVETHDQYLPSQLALQQMVQGNLNPQVFIDQVAGRSAHVFQLAAPIPEAAAQWLRDTPEVQRFVGVENDLGEIHSNLVATAETIVRLEAAIASPDHTSLYPVLAAKRSRIAAIDDDLVRLRNELAEQQLALISSSGELAGLTASRKQLAEQYAALGNPEQSHAARVSEDQAGFDKIDGTVQDIEGAIDSSQAIAVALRKYANDTNAANKAQLQTDLDNAGREAQAIEDELAAVRREMALGKDLAGVGDEGLAKARDLRKQLVAAQNAEHRVLAGFASSSRDRNMSQKLAALGDRAARVADQLAQDDKTISAMVEQGIGQVKQQLQSERQMFQDIAKELSELEAEAHSLGGTVLGQSFKEVKEKFDDVIIRTDVGSVDVSWSQKEDTDDDLKRLGLARGRELKQLRDEFKDILDQGTQKPSTPKNESTLPPPGPEGQNPEKGAADRVKPGGDQKTQPTSPTVKPEDKNPKQPAPKKGGGR